MGLIRLYRNYLSQDIVDKKYTWRDFTDRGASEKLSGYYAGRVGDSIYVWTLSGLKRFGYKAGSSAYYYMDICGFIRSRAEGSSNSAERVQYDPEIYFNPTAWAEQASTGDYVAVVRIDEKPTVVSQLYGSSNQYFPLTELKDEQCK